MNNQERLCADLIDDLDDLYYKHKPSSSASRTTLTREIKDGPQTVTFNRKKILLLDALKETFIDARTKTLKLSALVTFCFNSGVELASHQQCPEKGAQFVMRTEDYDIVVR